MVGLVYAVYEYGDFTFLFQVSYTLIKKSACTPDIIGPYSSSGAYYNNTPLAICYLYITYYPQHAL